MRIIFIIFLLIGLQASAQLPVESCKQVNDIALQERIHHDRIFNIVNGTAASNNFDVKYYRCEWEVDPAVYYITGKVTVYFIVTTASTTITFDLMNSLTVDSVKQRSTILAKQHSNNSLLVNFPGSVNAGTLLQQ